MNDLAARIHSIFATSDSGRVSGVTGVTAGFSGVMDDQRITRRGVIGIERITPANSVSTPITPLTPKDEKFAENCWIQELKASPCRDGYEERAAFIEFDGGIPRMWAEALARLHPDRPPPEITPRQWWNFYNDSAKFIDRWALQVAATGWTLSDVFGWDPRTPFQLISVRIGLGWHIDGGSVIDLTERAATIVRPNGQRLTVQRHGPFAL
jgi:hypothetical protein